MGRVVKHDFKFPENKSFLKVIDHQLSPYAFWIASEEIEDGV